MAAPAPVKAAARTLVRAWGSATAASRPLPEFLVVGAKRGGTTTLFRGLQDHPQVLGLWPASQGKKSPHYFDLDHHRGERWYRSHFASERARRRAEAELGYRPATFEASPYYLFHPLAPQRAKRTAPDATIVAVLRDPVERTYSHWKERRDHQEDLDFEAALAAEPERTSPPEPLPPPSVEGNVVQRLLGRIDAAQRTRKWLAIPIATIRRFGDNEGGRQAALIAYYGFFSLFPAMLAMVTVLGFVLQGHDQLRKDIADSAPAQFPIVGDQIASATSVSSEAGPRLHLPSALIRPGLPPYVGSARTKSAARSLDLTQDRSGLE